jgi:hypothetical protein
MLLAESAVMAAPLAQMGALALRVERTGPVAPLRFFDRKVAWLKP